MRHARDPIPSCGGGVANCTLLYMRRIQRVRFLVPGLVKKKRGDALSTGGLDKSSWTWLITADISSNIPFSKGSGRQGTK